MGTLSRIHFNSYLLWEEILLQWVQLPSKLDAVCLHWDVFVGFCQHQCSALPPLSASITIAFLSLTSPHSMFRQWYMNISANYVWTSI